MTVVRTHGERLSPVDASFLQLESPHVHMNVGWSSIGSVPAGSERPALEALRARAAGRLPWVPRCRQRLQKAPLGLDEPRWVDDPDFDLDAHIVALTDPDEAVSRERFEELRDDLLSTPLDRERPLWQIALVPRLEDGRVGMFGRVHHAMADGTAALQVAALVLDGDDDEQPESPPSWTPQPTPSATQRTLDTVVRGAQATGKAVGDAARAVLRPRTSARSFVRDAQRVSEALSEDLLPRAPDSTVNSALGPRRTLVGYRAALDELRPVSRSHSCTINDTGLAMVAGALRALSLEQDRPLEPLKAMIPVDVRDPRAEDEGLGNRVSLAAVWLPLQLDSAAERAQRIQSQTRRFKSAARPAGTTTLMSGLGLLPRGLRGAMLRAKTPRAYFNLTVSGIPGPRRPISMLGTQFDEIYPVVPMADGQALAIGMLRYDTHMLFGLHADPEAFPEVVRMPDLLEDELRALGAAPDEPPQPSGREEESGPRTQWHALGNAQRIPNAPQGEDR